RDELDRMQQHMTAERHALEKERKELRTEWVERQQKRIRELEAQFDEMQKRFDENVARVVEGVKERELRAQLEKSTRRKMQDVRSTAREERPASFAACFFQVAREARVLSLPQPRVRRFHRSASAFRQIVLPVPGYVSAGARPTPCAIPRALFRAHAARRSCVVACGPVRPGCDANRR